MSFEEIGLSFEEASEKISLAKMRAICVQGGRGGPKRPKNYVHTISIVKLNYQSIFYKDFFPVFSVRGKPTKFDLKNFIVKMIILEWIWTS